MKGWRSAKWRRPYIEERSLPDKVELYLPMESLISEENLRALHEKFGDSVYKLDYNRLSILSSAYLEEYVTNNSLGNQMYQAQMYQAQMYQARMYQAQNLSAQKKRLWYWNIAANGEMHQK